MAIAPPLFEVHLCTVTFGFMYGQYSRAGYSGARTVITMKWYFVTKIVLVIEKI